MKTRNLLIHSYLNPLLPFKHVLVHIVSYKKETLKEDCSAQKAGGYLYNPNQLNVASAYWATKVPPIVVEKAR